MAKERSILKPGIMAPDFTLSASNLKSRVSLKKQLGKRIVLLFFPSEFLRYFSDRLVEYEKKRAVFNERNAEIIGISDANKADLSNFSNNYHIGFALLSDKRPVCLQSRKYGTLTDDKKLLPTVFVIREEGMICRVYESSQYPHLPNPAVVMRAIIKLSDIPIPENVTEDDWQIGPSNAPVTLIEYSDYQCKHCAETFKTLEQIRNLYINKVLLVHRHLPLRHSHQLAQKAAEAAEAAGAQGKFWAMHKRLFEAEGSLERSMLIGYARDIFLDIDRFITELDNGKYYEAVNNSFKRAVRSKIKLPPTLFINKILLEGIKRKEVISARIDELLACVQNK